MEKEAPGIDALEELTADHQAVLSQLDTLHGTLGRLFEGEAGIDSEALSDVEAAVQFLETELEVHLRKEEQVLFPALSGYLPREGGPIGVMLLEHKDLRRTLRALRTALGSLRTDPQSASAEDVLKVGYSLIGLLRQHIKKEDLCLFPMSSSYLDRQRLLALGGAMRAIARESGNRPG